MGASAEDCRSCHGERDHKDPKTGEVCTFIDVDGGLAKSEHVGMVCGDCHAATFKEDPHPKARRADCVDCHVANDADGGVQFGDIVQGFKKSVHATKNEGFRCVGCHDPHSFRLATTRDHHADHNQVCLRCHGDDKVFREFAHKPPPDIAKAHTWLPNVEMHWKSIRCLDCHTGYAAPSDAHQILPKKEAVRRCQACHSAKPIQLLRLYARMRQQEVQEKGALQAAFVNDAYIVGATRNKLMDWMAFLVIGGTAGGIAGHGGLRILVARIRKRRGHAEESHHE